MTRAADKGRSWSRLHRRKVYRDTIELEYDDGGESGGRCSGCAEGESGGGGRGVVVADAGLIDRFMPVGVQLVARPWEEEALLELGVALEGARGAFRAPPEP